MSHVRSSLSSAKDLSTHDESSVTMGAERFDQYLSALEGRRVAVMSNQTGMVGDVHLVDALVERKFGPGGPFNTETPGHWKDTPRVRFSAQVHGERFKQCVALIAQHIFDHYGKFPGTVPSILVLPYLQAHHLDLEFYDTHFEPGAYLETHAQHMAKWHG